MKLPQSEEKKAKSATSRSNSILWIYNYDFEFELADELKIRRDRPPFHPWYFLNRSWHALLPMANADDEILVYEAPHVGVLESLRKKLGSLPSFRFVPAGSESNAVFDDINGFRAKTDRHDEITIHPWGWSPKAERFAVLHGSGGVGEDRLKAIRQVNAKTTSHRLRNQFLPQPSRIPGLIVAGDELRTIALGAIISEFVEQHGPSRVKHPFGTAGRLSDQISTHQPSVRKIRKWESWIRKSGEILLEQAVSARQEWSIQVEYSADGTVSPIALTRLFSGTNGGYLGTLIQEADQERLPGVVSDFRDVLKAVSSLGYTGPLGIDLMETEDGVFRLLEINGRLTMGRIAYEWHRALAGGDNSLFTNLFISTREYPGDDFFHEQMAPLEMDGVRITLLNLVVDQTTRTTMISVLIQGRDTRLIQEIPDRIKQRLSHKYSPS